MTEQVIWVYSAQDQFGHLDTKCPNMLTSTYRVNSLVIKTTKYTKCPNCWG